MQDQAGMIPVVPEYLMHNEEWPAFRQLSLELNQLALSWTPTEDLCTP
jgi:hypothetical protein